MKLPWLVFLFAPYNWHISYQHIVFHKLYWYQQEGALLIGFILLPGIGFPAEFMCLFPPSLPSLDIGIGVDWSVGHLELCELVLCVNSLHWLFMLAPINTV